MKCGSEEHGGPTCFKKAEKRLIVSKDDDSDVYLLCSGCTSRTEKELKAEGIKKQGFKIWIQSL